MFNPFKYRQVSQRDDEDDDVLYQKRNIPLSTLGEVNFDDEEPDYDVELPHKQPTSRRRSLFALCFVIVIFVTLVSLLITLIFYIASPLEYFSGQESNSTAAASLGSQIDYSTTITQSAVHHMITTSASIISSSTAVVALRSSSSVSVSSSLLPAPTRTAADIVVTTVSPTVSFAKTSVFKQTSTPTEDLSPNNNTAEILNSTVSTSVSTLIEPSVTANKTVSSSRTVYPSVVSSTNQVTENTVSMPTATNLPTSKGDSIHWHIMNLDGSSECTPFVIDVNNDGIDDIIYTYGHYTKDLDRYYCTSNTDYENACIEDTGCSVCGSNLVAVSGLNGEVIWLRNLTRPVFGIRCVMDVDDDGETDCFVIGRYHQWDAIDKATGNTIWEADASIGYPGYNFYNPLPLEDFDGDGIVDVLNVHGGDQTYGKTETNRSPALIVILSGKTGKKLIDPIVVPDGRESYMSPVRYTLADKDVVLFGTGGETINGSLWAISIDSIKEYVRSIPKPSPFSNKTEYIGCLSEFMTDQDKFRPIYDGTIYQLDNQERQPFADCPSFGEHLPISNKYKLCLYELYHSSSKGMIIPPVIIDMNNDNVQDLLIQSFDGHVVGLDGTDGRELWNRHIPGSESYK